MNKGLVALERMINNGYVRADVKELKTIKKELEEYEETKQDLKQVMKDYQDLGNSCYKKCKAFEIIKDKKVNVSLLLHTKDYFDYNDHIVRAQIYLQSNAECLTQEEYDFLKEELENE